MASHRVGLLPESLGGDAAGDRLDGHFVERRLGGLERERGGGGGAHGDDDEVKNDERSAWASRLIQDTYGSASLGGSAICRDASWGDV